MKPHPDGRPVEPKGTADVETFARTATIERRCALSAMPRPVGNQLESFARYYLLPCNDRAIYIHAIYISITISGLYIIIIFIRSLSPCLYYIAFFIRAIHKDTTYTL